MHKCMHYKDTSSSIYIYLDAPDNAISGAMPLFRRFIVPKVRWSEGSLVRRFVNPNLGTYFPEKISAADPMQARSRYVQIPIKMGIADHIVFVIVIITMVHAIISSPTSTSDICCRTTSMNLS